MSKTLEGYVDDGKAAPLANVSTVVTVVGAGTVITSGITDVNGHWYFDGLPEGQEYFVNVIDVDGNAVVRGPWSGEVRDVWVRDRLAIPDTAQAALPNGGQTTVGGLPLALSADAGNTLEWRATGLWATGGGMTQAAADLRYEPIDTAYTKAEADARYEPFDTAYTKTEADARYPLKTDIDPYPNYLTTTEADALFLTQAEGDARYVDVTGDTMSGSLAVVNSTSTRISNLRAAGSLQRPGVDFERWKTTVGTIEEVTVGSTIGTFGFNASGSSTLAYGGSIYAYVDAPIVGGTAPIAFSFYHATLGETYRLDSQGRGWFAPPADTSIFPATPGLYISGKWVGVSATGGNSLTWNADGFYVSAPAVTDLWVNTTGDTMTGNLTLTSPARIIAPQVGHELGWIGTTPYTSAMPDTQASIFIYRSGANWAGMGADGSGNFWLRTGLAGSPIPSLIVLNDGKVITQRDKLITQLGIDTAGDITVGTTRKIKFFDEVKDDKIAFYGTQFTIGIRGGEMAYFVAPAVASHNFYVNNVSKLLISDTLVTVAPSMNVAGKPLAISPDASNIVEWRANGFYAAAGAVSDIWVNTTGDTMTGDLNMTANVLPTVTNVRDLGSTSLRWRKVWATDADWTNAPTVGGSPVMTQTAADTRYVNAAGDASITGDLTTTGQFSFGSRNGSLIHSTSADLMLLNNPAAGYNTIYYQRWQTRAFYIYDNTVAKILFQVDQSSGDLTALGLFSAGGTTPTLATDANKRVSINKLTDPALPAGYTANPGLLVQHEGSNVNALSLAKASTTDLSASSLNFWHARGSFASKVALANGDTVGQINTWAWSGANWLMTNAIQTNVSGTVTTTAVPTDMRFYTADSAGALAARMSIGPAGLVGVGAKADGSAAATLDVQSTAAATPAFIARAHASAASGLAYFKAQRNDGLTILGANDSGPVTDRSPAGTTFTSPNKYVAWYNTSGTLLGYMPLYGAVS